jgi:hypothetical protein
MLPLRLSTAVPARRRRVKIPDRLSTVHPRALILSTATSIFELRVRLAALWRKADTTWCT